MKPPTEISKRPSLNDRRVALETKLKELTGVFQDRSELAIEVSADVLDTIHMATDRDVIVQRMNISAKMLSDVRAAIASLDNGQYGICEECEEPISAKRLKAIPWAAVCVQCQEARDRQNKEGNSDNLSVAA